MRALKLSMPWPWLGLLSAFIASACIGTIGDEVDGDGASERAASMQLGRLSFALDVAPSIRLGQVLYTLNQKGDLVRSGMLDLSARDRTVSALFVLPPATGYALALAATTLDGATCIGSAQFDITAGHRTPIRIWLRCPTPTSVGSTDVEGHFNICPAVQSIAAMPLHAAVGESISLVGVGDDADDMPRTLRYAWQTTGGTLTQTAAAQTALRCTEPGVVAVTLAVSDGDEGCPQAASAITIVCSASSDVVDDDADAGSAP